jgi:hypothetical protein
MNPGVPAMDFCDEYRELLVSAGRSAEQAVVTSFECGSAHVDSTGQSSSKTPTLVVDRGARLELHFSADRKPDEIELRLYPAAGVSASFMRWPEDLPTGQTPIDLWLPEPDADLDYVVRAGPGEYSLVVRASWEGEANVFYAISFVTQAS